ncbi:16S rRNA methyltransferase [Lactococcus fujiensis JCM 16395]|uniref:Ribosomal RNA small subunit methyltransferase A n=2 Tax=Lactococcus fujiensis TaxID=610251 RepID=A0A2A5RPF5_9LACT|nr:16S rRNA methyltransferase [Lactococcus fujiensis JCM 16395]
MRRHDFNFKKKFGQNFLTDQNILSKITATAELSKEVNVIEIGPGIGSLTQYLLENSAEVMAFEIDKTLIPILEETLADYENFQLVAADVLKIDLNDYIKNFKNPELPIKVVANLPYYITTPILMHLIESKIPFAEFVVMMQKEVADRIAAQPNSKAYGSLSIAVQYYMDAQVAFIVPRTVFIPAPNVDSAILRMVRREKPLVEVQDEDWFFKIMHSSFVHRRKTLMNNMQAEFGKEAKPEIEKLLLAADISPSIRAEALSIPDFAKLSDALISLK